MLIWIAIVLFIAWVLAFVLFHVVSFSIHTLLIGAFIALVVWAFVDLRFKRRRHGVEGALP